MSSFKKRPVPPFTDQQREEMNAKHAQGEFMDRKELRDVVQGIMNTIKNEELKVRQQNPWLEHQDAIGMLFFVSSFLGVVGTIGLYLAGYIHWSLTMIIISLSTSILHELEHDLIHNLYFKNHKWVQHVMFTCIWLTKLNIPPWYRKVLHLRHHLVSGQKEDIEERLIGLGLPLGFWRWLRTINHPMSVFMPGETGVFGIEKDSSKDFKEHGFTAFRILAMATPTIGLAAVSWHLFLGYVRVLNGWTFTKYDPALLLPLALWPYVRDFIVCLVIPNYFRNACLSLTAAYSHYYGDIPEESVFYQNQILDHWALYPLQLFSFNFACTHAIHHYVPNQPFYLRQMIANKANRAMIKRGVRLNDWDIVRRNNRYFECHNHHEMEKEAKALKTE